MCMPTILILGCGYTGSRVARRLLGKGASVVVTTRTPEELADLAALGAQVREIDVLDGPIEGFAADLVLHSIPVLHSEERTPEILAGFADPPRRIVYLSTTSVYGAQGEVDETTAAQPRTESERLRVAAENAVMAGPWTSLVLRSGAIYGPGRGVHVRMREGRYKLPGDGKNYVSRIHVEDLAALAEAALFSTLTGAYPVADDEPCTSEQMARFCAERLELSFPESDGAPAASRRVNGLAIRKLLGYELRYPSYRVGVAEALEGLK